MLNKEINSLIKDAMLQNDKDLLNVLRLIKSEFTKSEKDGVILNEVTETKILMKMVSQREDAIKQYMEGNRQDLVENEQKELDIIKEYIPNQPTEEEIVEFVSVIITAYKMSKEDGYKISMKDMKPILTIVQEKYSTVNGKIVAKVVQSFINN